MPETSSAHTTHPTSASSAGRVPFSEAFKDVSKGVAKIKMGDYLTSGTHPIIDQGRQQVAGYSNNEDGLFNDVPAIVFGDHTRCVKYVKDPFFAGADGVKILKPCLSNNVRYWYYALKSLKLENLGYSRHFKLLKQFTFMLPDSNRQNYICGVLDSLENLSRLSQRRLVRLDDLVKSRFIEMFGDLSVNDKNWQMTKLSEICDVRDGTHASPKYCKTGYPLMTSKNFSQGFADFSSARLISQDDFEEIDRRSRVDTGDIVMPMIGTIGHPVIIRSNRKFAIKNVALFKMEKSQINAACLKALLESDYFSRAVKSGNRGATQKFISLGNIRALPVPIIPEHIQGAFAELVAHVDKLRFDVQQQIEKLETLKDSLMQEYFG